MKGNFWQDKFILFFFFAIPFHPSFLLSSSLLWRTGAEKEIKFPLCKVLVGANITPFFSFFKVQSHFQTTGSNNL